MAVLMAILSVVLSPREPDTIPLVPAADYDDIARVFAAKLPELHLKSLPVDDRIASRALSLFISQLDPGHSFFLAADIAEFRKQERQLDDLLQKGDIDIAYRIVTTFRQRVKERCNYVEKLLADGLDLTKDETFTRPKSRRSEELPWPANTKAHNELWRKKIKDQYVAVFVSRSNNTEDNKRPSSDETDDVEGGRPTQEVDVRKIADDIVKQYRQYETVLNDGDAEWVLEMYLSAFAAAYDPHTDYMSAGDVKNFDIQMKLSLMGIGALLTSEDGAAKVVRVIAGGPAERQGELKAGDKIVGVAEDEEEMQSILHLPLNRAVELIRGKKGTAVVLKVIPVSDATGDSTVKIRIVRGEVKLEEQAARGKVVELTDDAGEKHSLGVVKLPAFYVDLKGSPNSSRPFRSSVRDVRDIVEGMTSTGGVEGIVFDLRGNPGGSLQEAVEMTGLFIRKGPVVQVKDRTRIGVLQDKDSAVAFGGWLVVLVDRMSASASEILAGALQDYGRAVIVGDSRTHGKGTVQSVTALSSAHRGWGSLKVTAAGFYRITGESTQVKGVSADIVVPSVFDGMDVGEDVLEYALVCPDIPATKTGMPEGRGWLGVLGALSSGGPGAYQKIVPRQKLISVLRRRSRERRDNDIKYAARRRLLDRFKARQNRTVVSLNLVKRLAIAKDEKRVVELELKTVRPESEKDSGETESSDLVLNEGLNILVDMISQDAAPSSVQNGVKTR